MNKLWISLIIFIAIISGGLLYNSFLNDKTDKILQLADEAYQLSQTSPDKCKEKLDEIDSQLESISALLCAFLDRDIINEAQDSIVSAKGLLKIGPEECMWGIGMMIEKIDHIKHSAKIKWKYLL